MSSQKPFQSNIYVPSARAFRTLYMHIPGFKNDHIALYDVLYHYWNEAYGYAYPTQVELQMQCGIGETSITKLTRELESWGLIEARQNARGSNKTYVLHRPIEDEDAFYLRFPLAYARKLERENVLRKRSARPKRTERAQSKGAEASNQAVVNGITYEF